MACGHFGSTLIELSIATDTYDLQSPQIFTLWPSIEKRSGYWTWSKCSSGNGTPLRYSCLENPMDGGAWWAAVHGVTKSRTRLNDFTFTFHFHALEKEMATQSSVLAWRISGMEEPGGLPSMVSHRVGHDWIDLAATAAAAAFSYKTLTNTRR